MIKAYLIFCNQCYRAPVLGPKNGSHNYVLTSCGWVLCQSCNESGSCPKCHSAQCGRMLISKDMDPKMLEYFQDPNNTTVYRILNFQEKRKQQFCRYLMKKNDNLKTMDETLDREMAEMERIALEKDTVLHQLREQLRHRPKMAQASSSYHHNADDPSDSSFARAFFANMKSPKRDSKIFKFDIPPQIPASTMMEKSSRPRSQISQIRRQTHIDDSFPFEPPVTRGPYNSTPIHGHEHQRVNDFGLATNAAPSSIIASSSIYFRQKRQQFKHRQWNKEG